ncbi:TetR family transcriptional regulator [Streptomyces sp. NPDC048415]|uniref:TetR family transcriptional regulator n=1 Tax=Streptomyces sp. NPDC048415 TaxID=3154822 RepID=UPI003426BAD8
MDIARAAAGLFMRHGLRGTRAEDIARAAGVAPRTFYRYFASKEEALGPLFVAGVQKWAEAVRDAPPQLPVPDALRHAIVSTLTPGVGVRHESLDWVRSLLRLAESNPALLRVWGEACQTAERTLAGVLAARVSPGAGEAKAGQATAAQAPTGQAAASAGQGSVGQGSAGQGPVGQAPAGQASAGQASAGQAPAGQASKATSGSPASPSPAPSPDLRLSAAVASAAVRVAVEVWAAGDDAAGGPDGPVALAVRNLAALRDFPWGAD